MTLFVIITPPVWSFLRAIWSTHRG